MAFSPEETAEIEAIRRKCLAGEETDADIERGLAILRQNRIAAQTGSTTARTTKAAAAAPVNTAAVLAGLRALGKGG